MSKTKAFSPLMTPDEVAELCEPSTNRILKGFPPVG
jgi:hypothetical protein